MNFTAHSARLHSPLLDGYVASTFDHHVNDTLRYWSFFLDHAEDRVPRALRSSTSASQPCAIVHPNFADGSTLDYVVDGYRGSVVPAQKRRVSYPHLVALGKKQRLPDGRLGYPMPRLHLPIFFKNKVTGQLGISLKDAFRVSALRCMDGLDQPVKITDRSSVIIEIDWPAYAYQHDSQIGHLDILAGGTTMRWAIQNAAKAVEKFLDATANMAVLPQQSQWQIGYGGSLDYAILPQKIILIGLLHVTAGRWRPILQLDGIRVMDFR